MRPLDRAARGKLGQSDGLAAEARAAAALEADGWTVLARRLRTAAGEIDLICDKAGLLAIVEVKSRAELGTAASSLGRRQQARLIAAAGLVLAEHPDWGAAGVRFDVVVIDRAGRIRRIADAFRLE